MKRYTSLEYFNCLCLATTGFKMSNQLAKSRIIAQTVTIMKRQLECFDWPFDWCLWSFIIALAHRQIFVINILNLAMYF